MDVNKFKKELSKLTGIDMFNPKYRDVFKRFFGSSKGEDSADDKEPETDVTEAESAANDTAVDTTDETETAEVNAENETEKADDTDTDNTETVTAADEPDETITEDNDADSESDLDGTQSELDTETENTDEIETVEEASDKSVVNMGDELLTTKLELELVRAGIREDRLETAKRLFMPEFKASGGNAEQLKELISQYPEWITKQGGAQGFGMPLGDKADALTNEEKALKRMGIDPRS